MCSWRGRKPLFWQLLLATLLLQWGLAHAQEQAAESPLTSGEIPASSQVVELAPDLKLKIQADFVPALSSGEQKDVPTFVTADTMEGKTEREVILRGKVELRRGSEVLKADQVIYQQAEDEALATGHVTIYRSGDRFTGSELKLKLDTSQGYFLEPTYALYQTRGRGNAKRLDFINRDQMRMTDLLYTTCPPEDQDWYLRAEGLELDQQKQEGVASDAVLYFKETPILWVPKLSFPLDDKRQSGFLPPVFGGSTKGGAETTLPFYWNIAPNHDMTLYPKLVTRRGTQLGTELRYLEPQFNGTVKFEYMPNDRLAERPRSAYSAIQTGVWPTSNGNSWSANWNLNHASDNEYYRDFSSTITGASQIYLPQDVQVNYNASWWNAGVRTTRYQTLQDPKASVIEPYQRLPQLSWRAAKQDLAGFDVGANAEFTRFSHAQQIDGDRFVMAPSVSFPWQTPGYYITPKMTLHYTHYALGQQAPGAPTSAARSVPIFSLDAGMVFERDLQWFGRDTQQTVEPRLYYLRVPYRNQDSLPNFDTAVSDFNFAQIFSDNTFSGPDRIADANQVTLAMTTRLLDAESGDQLVRAAVAQRISFEDVRVYLPGQNLNTTRRSDFLAAASGQLSPKLLLDTALQYNPAQGQIQKSSAGFRYQPELRKVVSSTYRYTRDLMDQVDLAGQWPLTKNWYGVGRINYSRQEKRLIETVAGLEYENCCWSLRMAVQRFAVATGNVNTTFFLQLQLKGLGGLGPNPTDMLKRSVPGYMPMDKRYPDRPLPPVGD